MVGGFMFYPAKVEPDGDGWMVSFPDIPEALTGAHTREEAIEMAKDALQVALEFYFDDRREIPAPSKLKKSQVAIELPASVAAKVLLLNEMVKQKVRPSELAKRLGTTAQEVNRLTQLSHSTKIDGINNALQALGKRLELRAI
jgi:antitoxin HicB